MKITYQSVKIKLQKDEGNICFAELRKEGFKENQIVKAERQIINGKPTKWFYFGDGGNRVAYEGETATVISEAKEKKG